jgi:glycosyltransferase involved in cell wall biosynthesis
LNHRIGIVSTRLAGTDGVSLETRKWVKVFCDQGHACFFFAGELDWPQEQSHEVPEAHFNHPEIQEINRSLFVDAIRTAQTTAAIHRLKDHLKAELRRFVERFDIQILVTENALSLPMNVPLGLALTEFIAENRLSTIAHHHDFWWERRRYLRSAAEDLLQGAFPPMLPCITHVTISSHAARRLARRAGAVPEVIPNVMPFEVPPPAGPADYAKDLPRDIGVEPGEKFILQPTRIVPRKRIERAIELVRRLEVDAALVISHSAGDEGREYQAYLREYAELLGVKVLFIADRIGAVRGCFENRHKVYDLQDVYLHADLVTYPSLIEGFGNAFLEAVYYRRPLVMSFYEIYFTDIRPQGFRIIGFDNFIDRKTVEEAHRALFDRAFTEEMVEHNYELGRRYYSFAVLGEKLHQLMARFRDAR